jgi:hypothetical protein
MEKNIAAVLDVLEWLPVGYMINFPYDNFPINFIEVDGQTLSKSEYQDVFDILKGNVIDEGDTFVLPRKDVLKVLFGGNNEKIILRLK